MKFRKYFLIILLPFFVGCGSSGDSNEKNNRVENPTSTTSTTSTTRPKIVSVNVELSSNSIFAGDVINLVAIATMSDGTKYTFDNSGAEVKWSILAQPEEESKIEEDTGVLTVGNDSAGQIIVKVTGIGEKWDGQQEVSVTVKPIVVTSVSISSSKSTIRPNSTLQLTASAMLSNGTTHVFSQDGTEIKWSIISQDGSSAIIDEKTGILSSGLDSVGNIELQVTGYSDLWSGIQNHQVKVFSPVKSIVTTGETFVALKEDGTVVKWGKINYGVDYESIAGKLVDVKAIYSTIGSFCCGQLIPDTKLSRFSTSAGAIPPL
ncbi:hypothetical protein BIT28_26755 [Photobacterium proteolyticum]|uniref:Uncharacterized protein n=1 Tax=Photobacterium proteolyticum TaxID=1903952 RepID=A0A1Q9H1V2_9GAMM|nr:hypothetical protein [Photobacterium proteolyticum]OLQ81689.1 hypothetical protein BIT28_26755 [Photobacterium proteolyticum]